MYAIPQITAEDSLFHRTLSNFKLVEKPHRKYPRFSSVCHDWYNALIKELLLLETVGSTMGRLDVAF